MTSTMTKDIKLKILTKHWNKEIGTTTYNLDEEILSDLGFAVEFNICKTEMQLINLAKIISNQTILSKKKVQHYINNTYPQFTMDDKMFKKFYTNNRNYGYLHHSHIKLSKVMDVIDKSTVDNIFQEVVHISPESFFKTLGFANDMVAKLTGGKVTYGTLYDKVARRQGSILNYIQRHMVGKLGEVAVIELLNKKSTTGFKATMSFDASKVESSDISMLEDSSGLIRFPKKSIQVKTAIGLNSMVLKEDKTKVDGSKFQADYYVFVQLLMDPLEVVQSLLDLISSIHISTGETNISNILRTVSSDKKATARLDKGIAITAKVAGFVNQNKMTSSVYMKDDLFKPLGNLSNDSYCVRLSELDTHFIRLASEVF